MGARAGEMDSDAFKVIVALAYGDDEQIILSL